MLIVKYSYQMFYNILRITYPIQNIIFLQICHLPLFCNGKHIFGLNNNDENLNYSKNNSYNKAYKQKYF